MATTSTKRLLSEDQIAQYSRDGFLVVPNLIPGDIIEAIKTRGSEIAHGDVPKGFEKMIVKDVRVAKGEVTPEDPEKGLWKFIHPDRFDQTFKSFGETPQILDVIEDLIGPDIKVFLTMWIYKPPRLHAVHHYHQDSYYFQFGPHDKILGVWIPFDEVDAGNGTITVVPGSHKLGLLPHGIPGEDKVNAKIYGVSGYDNHPDQVTLDMNPGDALFFHSRLLHTTGPNVTDRHRRVITLHVASAQCEFMPLQENQADQGDPREIYEFRLVRGKAYDGRI